MTEPVPGHIASGPAAVRAATARPANSAGGDATAFREALGVEFSRHAAERMRQRGLQLNEGDAAKIGEAVDRCASKGSKDALLLLRDLGLIVNIKNRKVLTAVDTGQLQEKVFTNIDSTVILRD